MYLPKRLMPISMLLLVAGGGGGGQVTAKWTTRRPYIQWPVGIGAPEATSSFYPSTEFESVGQVNGGAANAVDSTARSQSDGQCRPPITELGTGAEVSADTGNNDDGLGKGGRGLTQWNDIGEIKFMTDSGESNVNSGASEKLWCKIKCVDGEWVGPLCSANGENGRYQPLLKSCHLRVPEKEKVLLSFQGQGKPFEEGSEKRIAHGTVILGRCIQLGSMKLLGVSSIQCRDGHWSHKLPKCLSTTPTNLTTFTDDYPPAIKINIPRGSAGENAAGELVVRPSSIIHLDCVFYRRVGTPSWYWTGLEQARTYPMGWAMAPEERLWRYRISIYSAQVRDEGEFTCATPRGHSNSIRIIVRTVECSPLGRIDLPLKSTISANQAGSPSYAGDSVDFSCSEGYRLQGPNKTTCLTSGVWSESEKPFCELIQCPFDIYGAGPRLEFEFTHMGYNGVVQFSCPPGFKLVGPTNATCQQDMEWHPPPPYCHPIECPQLLPPLNGRVMDSGNNYVGEVAKFYCNRNLLLVGEPVIECTQNGNWSHPSPTCKLLCMNPGAPEYGLLTPDLTHYEIGASIMISCQADYKYVGRPWLVCQPDGTWSFSIGLCLQS